MVYQLLKKGFKGIFIIIDYLSKFPYAVAIKNKNSNELAFEFFKYISMFGPPKEIVSDQGKEFVNGIMAELCKLNGMEHGITSSYSPHSNGQAERFNQSLIGILKRLVENNKDKWPQFRFSSYALSS